MIFKTKPRDWDFNDIAFECLIFCCYPNAVLTDKWNDFANHRGWLADYKLQRHYQKTAPKRLPNRRRRLNTSNPRAPTSSLLKLPTELRMQIYEDVIGKDRVELTAEANKIVNRSSSGGLSLLLACRQTYIETIDLFYSTKSFAFDSPKTFLYFETTILPQRLAIITDLTLLWDFRFHDIVMEPRIPLRAHRVRNGSKPYAITRFTNRIWLQFWTSLVEKMPGLNKVRLELAYRDSWVHEDELELGIHCRWAQPLLALRGLNEFRFIAYVARYRGRKSAMNQQGKESAKKLEGEIERIVTLPKETNSDIVLDGSSFATQVP